MVKGHIWTWKHPLKDYWYFWLFVGYSLTKIFISPCNIIFKSMNEHAIIIYYGYIQIW
jgi:hypothetical protein